MIKETFRLLHTLKVLFFSIIVVYFLAMIGITPLDLSNFFGAKFGSAVGMSTSVAENPFSKLAMQLEEKEKNLDARERGLVEREEKISSGFGYGVTIYFLAAGILILFFLILANFYMDFKRRNKQA